MKERFPIALFSVVFALAIAMFFTQFVLLASATGWRFLEDIGNAESISGALGLFSALFSGLAAFGLLYTITLQRGALRLQQNEIRQNASLQMRMLHLELLRFSIDNPDLSEVWRDTDAPLTDAKSMYVNLILSHWQTMFTRDLMTEGELRLILSERMRGHFMSFWERHRESRSRAAQMSEPAEQKFHSIVEQAYQSRLMELSKPASRDSAR